MLALRVAVVDGVCDRVEVPEDDADDESDMLAVVLKVDVGETLTDVDSEPDAVDDSEVLAETV